MTTFLLSFILLLPQASTQPFDGNTTNIHEIQNNKSTPKPNYHAAGQHYAFEHRFDAFGEEILVIHSRRRFTPELKKTLEAVDGVESVYTHHENSYQCIINGALLYTWQEVEAALVEILEQQTGEPSGEIIRIRSTL